MSSPEEIQKAIQDDPWGYHSAVLERSNLGLDKVIEAAKVTQEYFVVNYIGGLVKAIKLHSEELRIFRTIESKIAIPGTSKEEIDSLFEVLKQFREKSRKEAEALASVSSSSQQQES